MGGVALVIPVINEGETMTAARARQAGALVIVEPRSGYGAACLAGIRAVPAHCQIVAFIDGDGSDDPQDISRLVSPIQSGAHDFVIGCGVSREAWRSTSFSQAISPAWLFTHSMASDSPTWARCARSETRCAQASQHARIRLEPGSANVSRPGRLVRCGSAGERAAWLFRSVSRAARTDNDLTDQCPLKPQIPSRAIAIDGPLSPAPPAPGCRARSTQA
jgi:hypothetical protein